MRTTERHATNALLRRSDAHTDPDRARGCDPVVITKRYDTLHELCHDVRQPAAAIMAIVAAAEIETDLPPAARERLRQITMEARRISELCRHVLGHGDGPVAVSLGDLAAEVVASAGVASLARVTFEGEAAVVEAEPAALRRALGNLVDNAVRAAGPGGQVEVTTHLGPMVATVVVSDSGPGFGEGATGVSGLGMRIAGRVARELGGRLDIGTSARLGGAEVTLSLPSLAAPGTCDVVERAAP